MPLPRTTLISIIAASSGAGLLLSLIFLYRCLRRPRPAVPLPPKQELARYREQYPVQSRPGTWYDPPSASFAASRSSLVPPDSRGHSPFRHGSFNTSETPSDELSIDVPPLPLAVPLQLPNLAFDHSSTSLSTAETRESPPLASATDSSFSRNHSRPSRRPRPLSVGSSSGLSRHSRNNTIRGVPHGPHSQVQIVLPAPLGAFNDTPEHRPRQRYSVVDQWASMPVSGPQPIPRPSSTSGPRRSSSHSSIARRLPADVPPVPPVPESRVAPVTANGMATNQIAERARGRSDGPIPPSTDPPPSTRLQKRSRSRGR